MTSATAGRLLHNRIGAVVFDLDGTLIDSAEDVRSALNEALATVGRRAMASSEMVDLIGDGARPMIERALLATGGPVDAAALDTILARYTALYMASPASLTVVFSGVVEMLDTLQAAGIKLGLCTNKPHLISLAVLQALGLREKFDAIYGGDALPVRKPDPEHLLATLRALHVSPERAAYVGDSAVDVAAARRAGVPIVLLSHGYSKIAVENLGADVVLKDFAGLIPALARLPAWVSSN